MVDLELIKQMVSYTHDLCFIVKNDIIVGSNNVSRYTDMYDEQVIGQKIVDIFSATDAVPVVEAIVSVMPKSNLRVHLKDNKEYSFNVAKIEDYTVLLGEDTDSNAFAEESHKQLCIAVNEMSEGVLIISKTGQITFANNAVVKLLKLDSYDDLINRDISSIFDKRGANCIKEKLNSELKEKGAWTKKFKCVNSEDETIPVDVSFTLVKGNGSIVLVRDLSNEVKLKELKRKQLTSDLENIIGIKLINDSLQAA